MMHISGGLISRVFPDWKWFKATMLRESNGVASATNNGAVGLFQLRLPAIQDIKPGTSSVEEYLDPEKNIDVGIQYLKKIHDQYLMTALNNRKQSNSTACSIFDMAPEDVRNLCFFTYIAGSGSLRDRIRNRKEPMLTYPMIEADYKAVYAKADNVREILQCVPTTIWIYNQI